MNRPSDGRDASASADAPPSLLSRRSNRSWWPKTWVDPETRSTRPMYLFSLFFLVNLATMSDRAIIPGASVEFSAFIAGSDDAPHFVRHNPDAGLGVLQAAFIGGYSIAIVLSGHLVHMIKWKNLVLSGLCIWWLGVLGSGNAEEYNSFWVLLLSRTATGVAEAAFHVVAPPLIQDRAGKDSAGLWLSIFLTGVPVGLAWGYIYGSLIANNLMGWKWAYYLECLLALPLLIAMAAVKDEVNGGILNNQSTARDRDGGKYGKDQSRASMVDDGLPPTAAGGDAGAKSREDSLLQQRAPSLDKKNDYHSSSMESSLLSSPEQLQVTSASSNTPLLAMIPSNKADEDDKNSDDVDRDDADQASQPPSHSSSHSPSHLTLCTEMRTCLSSPILVAISLGYSSMIAIVASLGTFGGAYLLALQLFDDEQTAAVSFGISAALAGIIGTPVGGKLVDRVMSRHTEDESSHAILTSLLPMLNTLVAISMVFVVPTLFMTDGIFFLGFLFIGWTLLFAAQTGITTAAMMSVEPRFRPNANAFLMLSSHVLGDVPAPIVLGWIKDSLAPACRIKSSGEFEDLIGCEEQGHGLRMSLAIAYVWIVWFLLFFEVARRLALRKVERESRNGGSVWTGDWGRGSAVLPREGLNQKLIAESNGGGRSVRAEEQSSFEEYHSRFRPPSSADDWNVNL